MKSLKLQIALSTFLIMLSVQWHAHYLNNKVSFWFDFLPITLLASWMAINTSAEEK